MELGASVWMVVLSVAAAWLTVVCLILARVPRLPNILDDPGEQPEAEGNNHVAQRTARRSSGQRAPVIASALRFVRRPKDGRRRRAAPRA